MDLRFPVSRLTNPLEPPTPISSAAGKNSFEVLPPPELGPTPKITLPRRTQPRVIIAACVLLAAATLAVYYPVHSYPFNALNDGEYVANNVHVHELNWRTVKWSLTSFHAANWHPLTWLSHAVDYRLFSLNAGGHHAINLLLHIVNSLVLFWVLRRATGAVGRSFMVAALFALHPINVESVAWIAERKNVLSLLFLLLALGAYRWYAAQPRLSRYNLVALFFVLGLLAKPQVITLPFVFLLWDYWPLGRMFPSQNAGEAAPYPPRRLSWLILEKLPLLALSVASAVITVQAQQAGGAMGGVVRSYSLATRLANAAVAYVRYVGHAIWPTHLAFFYPHGTGVQRVWLESLLILLVISGLAIADTRRRYLSVGWLWFLGTLVPMIGLVQVGGQAMADRYGYLSFIGLFIAVCWGVTDLASHWRISRAWVVTASVLTLMTLSLVTRRQLSYWSDDVALWAHAVEVSPKNSAAENMLGERLQKAGRPDEAIEHFRAAAADDPMLPYPHYHLAIYDEQRGDLRPALEQFKKVIALTQTDIGMLGELRSDTFVRMSSIYEALGESREAEQCITQGLAEHRKAQRFAAP